MYYDIRRGERVPDKDLDQVSAWLKLSGVVCRRDGLLEVRNAIYEQVFQKQWARDHLTLYVNWRRRLTRAALVLIVLIAMVTGPLALYGWVQKAEADRRRGEVEVQNAYLTKIAESLKVTSAKDKEEAVKALANAQRVLDDLQAYKEASGGKSSTNLVEQIRLAERTRDDLQAKLDQSLKANEYLRSENSRLQKAGGAAANAPAASGAPTADPATAQLVTVPNVVGLDQAIAMLAVRSNGLVVGRITRVSTTAAESTVLVQSPNPRTAVQRDTPVDLTIAVPAVKAGEHATGASPGQQGATASYTAEIGLSRIFVYHDSASPSADWSFEIFVDNNSVMKLPGAAYQDRKEPYPSSARATIRSITPGARIRIVGTRLKPSKPLTVEGAAVIPVAGDAFESPVSVAAKSGDPQDGLFLFVMRVTPGR
jgi:hypothetical protein